MRVAVAVTADAALAALAYLLAYRLRFPGALLATFLPTALRSLPLVVVCQIATMAAAGAYGRSSQASWLSRLMAGTTLGTIVGTSVTAAAIGFQGISRVAFLVDLTLLMVTTVGWRSVRLLWVGNAERAAIQADATDMIDRADRTDSFGATFAALYRYRELLKDLVLKDLKLKYRGSVFGFLWSLVNPLLMIVVYTIAFKYIIRVKIEGFVFYLLLGVLAWTFFSNSAAMSTGAIADNGGLLKSVFFPRAILPIATVLFNLAQYLLTTVVFLPLMLVLFHVPLVAPMLLFPVFLALQVLFTIGVALILATGTAFFRDVRHLVEIGLMLMFWSTPIFYELRQVPELLRWPILLSPMSPFILAYQQIFYYRQWPDLSVWLVAVTYAAGAFVVGAALILAFEDRFAEQV